MCVFTVHMRMGVRLCFRACVCAYARVCSVKIYTCGRLFTYPLIDSSSGKTINNFCMMRVRLSENKPPTHVCRIIPLLYNKNSLHVYVSVRIFLANNSRTK